MVHNAFYIGVKQARGLSVPEKEMNIDICVIPDFQQGSPLLTGAMRYFLPIHIHTFIRLREKQKHVFFFLFFFHRAQMRGKIYILIFLQYFHLVTGLSK